MKTQLIMACLKQAYAQGPAKFIKALFYLPMAFVLAPVFKMDSGEMLEELIGAGVLIFVAVIFDVYILGNQSLFNTTEGAPGYEITSVVVPIFQVVILVVCILVAVFLLPKIIKKAGSK